MTGVGEGVTKEGVCHDSTRVTEQILLKKRPLYETDSLIEDVRVGCFIRTEERGGELEDVIKNLHE